ncbi:cytochrome ubiquinol oxidase subunit II [Acuticoccus sp. MNP-M23]|uniref:cytochrome c oxidase subunit II n=1 Tax=Acuticoccus sp. MNP-M23 TaxID=3072793 RepID=UPI002816848C|nr:cytochrome ubiquinol oxidase subunit II [Acuticoccus sp. MNP-M23]WMS41937.1 cytochrome ubiquinol oxidase subunit II [Acuticoccus sp. MNP-M23]
MAGGVLASLAVDAAFASQTLEQSFLQPMGPIADEQFTHLLRVIAISMVVILPVLIGVPLILWRYRYAKPRGRYTSDWEYSPKLEIAMWGVPALVVVVLGGWLWYSTSKLDPYNALGPDPLRVQVIGLDWKWLFIYPEDGIATVDELVIPVGRPVELTLTTDTVMQSLLIAPLTGQIYAMPGMTTKLNFAASRPGEAEGENTQFNGNSFGRQKFTVRALEPDDYTAWVSKGGGELTLDEATYTTLRKRSVLADARTDLGLAKSAEPITMTLAQPDMFRRIVAKYHQPGGGAATRTWGGTGLPESDLPEIGR